MPFDAVCLGFGDIILVPFPFTNQTASKQRPAVVISAARYNAAKPDVIVMAVTSQLAGDTRADDVPVLAWQAAGLLKPSAIKPVIATLEQGLTIRKLGSLEAADRDALRTALAEFSLRLGHYDAADAYAVQSAGYEETPNICLTRARIALARGDDAGARDQVAKAKRFGVPLSRFELVQANLFPAGPDLDRWTTDQRRFWAEAESAP